MAQRTVRWWSRTRSAEESADARGLGRVRPGDLAAGGRRHHGLTVTITSQSGHGQVRRLWRGGSCRGTLLPCLRGPCRIRGGPIGAEARDPAVRGLVGSTARASDEDPERTRLFLDRFYDGMAAEIRGTGGTLEKFAGDAVMAAFGAPPPTRTMLSAPSTPPCRCSGDSMSCLAIAWLSASASTPGKSWSGGHTRAAHSSVRCRERRRSARAGGRPRRDPRRRADCGRRRWRLRVRRASSRRREGQGRGRALPPAAQDRRSDAPTRRGRTCQVVRRTRARARIPPRHLSPDRRAGLSGARDDRGRGRRGEDSARLRALGLACAKGPRAGPSDRPLRAVRASDGHQPLGGILRDHFGIRA